MGKHLDIMFEESAEYGGPGKYVGLQNDHGCDPGGKWFMRGEFWVLRIKEEEWPTVSSSNETSKTSSNFLKWVRATQKRLIP